jgi:hypothetical protein
VWGGYLVRAVVLVKPGYCGKGVGSMESSPDRDVFLPPVEDDPFAAETFSAIFQARGFFFFFTHLYFTFSH